MRFRLLAASLAAVLVALGAHAGTQSRHHRPPPTLPLAYGSREDVVRFAEEVSDRQPGLDATWVRTQLERARFVKPVTQLIMPPPVGTAKNWAAYRARFVERERIDAGVDFWRRNAEWLAKAEERWGVPPAIVVGVIGVETFYGRITGGFRVIDALATLSFDFPAGRRDRAPFFRGELEEFLLWCAREQCNPEQVQGSFAGAMGLPQFMPGSLNRYAVDFDEDGHIDLGGNAADAIGSVAHYLAAFGWERDLPTYFRVAAPVDTTDRAVLLVPDIVPTFSADEMAARGAELEPRAKDHDGPLALVELQNGADAPSYVAGTRNFYAVTRYNWSSYYAMAVIDLGQAVAHRIALQEDSACCTASSSTAR
jgi:membrane-bound lytic murein transglycosylase B